MSLRRLHLALGVLQLLPLSGRFYHNRYKSVWGGPGPKNKINYVTYFLFIHLLFCLGQLTFIYDWQVQSVKLKKDHGMEKMQKMSAHIFCLKNDELMFWYLKCERIWMRITRHFAQLMRIRRIFKAFAFFGLNMDFVISKTAKILLVSWPDSGILNRAINIIMWSIF